MESIITYSLKNDHTDSEQYYRDAASFSEEVLATAEAYTGMMVKDFCLFISNTRPEELRSEAEHHFELLVLGTLWRAYGGRALRLPEVPHRLLSWLCSLRRRSSFLRPGADYLRGLLMGLFYSPLNQEKQSLNADLDGLEQLLRWLAVAEEYHYEEKRLRLWFEFLANCPEEKVSSELERIIAFSAWFESRAVETLGGYSQNVEGFVNRSRRQSRRREDYLFRCRKPVEYHLNMVGAEIMNISFREEFLATNRRIVLLPACMCKPQKGKCKVKISTFGYRCAHCSRSCRVSQLTELGEKQKFNVSIIPHKSSLSRLRKEGDLSRGKMGVVGVACVTSLISGGLMLKGLNIPAQCVLLDYCGCKKHWHQEGIPTDINVRELQRILKTV